jgi:hypothetical protein
MIKKEKEKMLELLLAKYYDKEKAYEIDAEYVV